MSDWITYLAQEKERFLAELMEFLRIPSISALPAHRPDVERAALWLQKKMKTAGIQAVRILPTAAHPIVYGEWLRAPGKPTVLIYGHFDIQPVDPLSAWDQPPFEPVIKESRIYGRGATDDKGNLFIPLTVVEAMLQTEKRLPVNLKFLFEGQEEILSPQLPDFMAANEDLLSCDLVLSADGSTLREEGQPALVMGTRGLACIFIDVQGPDHDLHSGGYGGTILNPIHALVQILNSMHDEEGRITVDGFTDDVRPLSNEERIQMAQVPFAEAEYLRRTGSPSLFGEPGFTTHERAWARPTLEINGLYGGFEGEGLKTVLPSRAHAKISCRLVADQDPDKIADLVVRHVHKTAPRGLKVTTTKLGNRAHPYLIPQEHPGLQAAASVLKEMYGKEPYRIRMGGSIPANALFHQLLGVYTIIFGFGLPDERQHAPNEFFRLSSFTLGQKAYGRLLERLA
jgi:acetylornithine deacetylase/succinyl-diaminopimelate desuccinylase-like protein